MTGQVPSSMSGSCGCSLNGNMYIFGGCDDSGQTNQVRNSRFGCLHNFSFHLNKGHFNSGLQLDYNCVHGKKLIYHKWSKK